MPRDICVGNGRVLINFDCDYHMRDIYFPSTGKENHSQRGSSRFGVFCEGVFSWVHDSSWEKKLEYLPEALVSDVTLYNAQLGLRIVCNDTVDFYRDIYLRRINIHNLFDRDRKVTLFFHHDLNIYENSVGDTAYFRPDDRSLVHYKGDRYFFMNCYAEGKIGWDQFATGIKGLEGIDGTWRDAEDGVLSGNPITQGSVDSVGAVDTQLKAQGESQIFYWIAMGESYPKVKELHHRLLNKGFDELVNRTINFWHFWANKESCSLDRIPESIKKMFIKSLLIIRSHVDQRGAIIASTDSDVLKFNRDTYCYMWPRDGALTAYALDRACYPGLATPFYYFCRHTITTEGYMLHKYNPDKSLGSSWHPWLENGSGILPIQEDGTALVIWSLWKHFLHYRDVEALKELYRPLIIRAANFMKKYRNPTTHLPLPSYDLWEERKGVFSFAVGSIYGALKGAAYFAQAFGEFQLTEEYLQTAQEMKEAVEKFLWDPEETRFLRGLVLEDGILKPDKTIDASVYGLFYFGMFEADDPRIVSTMKNLKEKLWVKTNIGGIARYQNDYYYQMRFDTDVVPGNPWIISTLWYAQWLIAKAKSSSELSESLEILQWVTKHAKSSGVLPEQLDPTSGTPLSVCPLTWSHATFVLAVTEYLEKKGLLKE